MCTHTYRCRVVQLNQDMFTLMLNSPEVVFVMSFEISQRLTLTNQKHTLVTDPVGVFAAFWLTLTSWDEKTQMFV